MALHISCCSWKYPIFSFAKLIQKSEKAFLFWFTDLNLFANWFNHFLDDMMSLLNAATVRVDRFFWMMFVCSAFDADQNNFLFPVRFHVFFSKINQKSEKEFFLTSWLDHFLDEVINLLSVAPVCIDLLCWMIFVCLLDNISYLSIVGSIK